MTLDLRQLPAFEHAPDCPVEVLLYARAQRPRVCLARCVNCQRVGLVPRPTTDVSRETSTEWRDDLAARRRRRSL